MMPACLFRRRRLAQEEAQYGKEPPTCDQSDISSHSQLEEKKASQPNGTLSQEQAPFFQRPDTVNGNRGGSASVSDNDSPALVVLQRRR